MPATVQLEHLQGGPPPTAVPVTAVRFRSDDTSGVDTGAPIIPPDDIRAQLVGDVLGSAANATAFNVLPLTSEIFVVGAYAILDAGGPQQEVIRINTIDPDPASAGQSIITACVRRNHSRGVVLTFCNAAFSKSLQFHVLSPPSNSITNVRFFRNAPLPYGVYDQFRVLAAYQPGTNVPWVSDPLNVYSAVPTSYPVLINAAPVQSVGPLVNLVEIQWIYVARLQGSAGKVISGGNVTQATGASSGSAGCQPAGMSSAVDCSTGAQAISAQLASQLQVQPANYHFSWQES
jgi:hypothetical protein